MVKQMPARKKVEVTEQVLMAATKERTRWKTMIANVIKGHDTSKDKHNIREFAMVRNVNSYIYQVNKGTLNKGKI